MEKFTAKASKTHILPLFTLLLATFMAVSCSEPEGAKVVRRSGDKGHGGTGKPTRDVGVNAAGYAAFNLLASSEVSRIWDIVLNGADSERKHKCQTLNIEKDPNNKKKEVLTLVSNPRSSRPQCPNGWNATEKIEVNYEKNIGEADNRILNVQKQHGQLQMVTNRAGTRRDVWLTSELAISFEKDDLYKFEFAGLLNIKNVQAKGNGSQSTPESAEKNSKKKPGRLQGSRRDIEISAEGLLDLATRSMQLTKSQSKHTSYTTNELNDRFENSSELSMVTQNPDDLVETFCGWPFDIFTTSQIWTPSNQKPDPTYNPQLVVSAPRSILVTGTKVKFEVGTTCNPGFQDIEDVSTAAERFVQRRAIPAENGQKRRTAPYEGRNKPGTSPSGSGRHRGDKKEPQDRVFEKVPGDEQGQTGQDLEEI